MALIWQTELVASVGPAVAITFSPFALFDPRETVFKLPLSLAFPLAAAVGAWWTRSSDAMLRFVWTVTVIALFVTLCIVETGERMMHGNFAWTGQTGVFLVYVESLLFLLAQPLRAWARVVWMLSGIHVVAGVIWYSYVFRTDFPSWW